MWQLSPEEYEQLRHRAKDAAHAILFVTSLVFFGAVLVTGNLGFAGVGMGLLAVVGISRA